MGSSSNRYAPRLPQQETKSSTKLLALTDPILGPENLLKTGFAQKGLPSTLQRTLTQLTQVARPGPRLNTSIPDLVPVQRMNARIPVPMWLSQQPWSTDRIEYNWLQRMHLLTNSLCTATLMLVHGTSAEHSV